MRRAATILLARNERYHRGRDHSAMVVLAVDNPKSGEAQGREPLICGQIWREKEKGIETLKEDLEAWDPTVAMDHNSGDNGGAATVKEEMSNLA